MSLGLPFHVLSGRPKLFRRSLRSVVVRPLSAAGICAAGCDKEPLLVILRAVSQLEVALVVGDQ